MAVTLFLLVAAIVIVLCVILNNVSNKIGIPMLLAFILLGMAFGSDGVVKIAFDNFDVTETICSVALIFIMFYGGFGTRWKEARPVVVKAGILSTLGVAMTAGLTGLFCHYVLKMPAAFGFLIGAVLSSTDAASVFSILRSRKLGLKYNTASLLEIESGSNDPCSYMLTVIMMAVIEGTNRCSDCRGYRMADEAFPLVHSRIRHPVHPGRSHIFLCHTQPGRRQRLPERLHRRHRPGQRQHPRQEVPGTVL